MVSWLALHWPLGELSLLVLAAALALAFPGGLSRLGRRLARPLAPLVRRPSVAVLLAFALPLALRAALLPWVPIPHPRVPDEFSYLLGADTFASGRLANPTPPEWEHFETPFVLLRPTYASMYPPGQALVLALGQRLFGHPWWGAWLSVGAMCAAVAWMLSGWLPSGWALFGALYLALRLGVYSYWMDSYWGGAVAATGGALFLGALPRVLARPRVGTALVLGLGLALLANSRPYEGLVLAAPAAVLLMVGLARHVPGRAALGRVVLPLSLVLAATAVWVCVYDAAVTGHALEMPYMLHARTYGVEPNLVWQAPAAPVAYRQPALAHVFELWRERWLAARTWGGFRAACLGKLVNLWTFFGTTLLLPALLAVPFALARRGARPLALLLAVGLAGLFAEISFFPHYAAPFTGLLVLVLVLGARRLAAWRPRGRPVGRAFLVAAALAFLLAFGVRGALETRLAPVHFWAHPHDPWSRRPPAPEDRELVARGRLAAGRHLVLVRYTAEIHHRKWTYDLADPEHARIVWASELDPASDRRLVAAFPGREVWLALPDETPPVLVPHPLFGTRER